MSQHKTTYPVAFPTACLSVQLSGIHQSGSEAIEHIWAFESVTSTTAGIIGYRWSGWNPGAETARFYLFAIGY
ncbi:MAG: gp53-like domain-containing protein [Enterobacteriaceae bacterium]